MTRLFAHTFARLVFCLLIVALPLQGYAAGARACCMVGGNDASSAMAMQMSTQMSGQGDAGHCHHKQMQHAAACADHHAASGHGSSCAVCAACCAAFLTAPSADMPPPLSPLLSFATPAATPLVTGPVPTGLERPPRLRAI